MKQPTLATVLVALLFTTELMPQDKRPESVVRAKKFELVDESGAVRMTMGVLEDGTARLDLFDQEDRLRTSLVDMPSGMSGLFLFDGSGALRGAWTTGAKGQAGMAQLDAAGQVRGAWEMDDTGAASLAMNNAQGLPRVSMRASEELDAFTVHSGEGNPSALLGTSRIAGGASNPALVLYGQQSHAIRMSMNLDDQENPMLALNDSRGQVQAALMAISGQGVGLGLYDSKRRPRSLIGVQPDGQGGVVAFDGNGAVEAAVPLAFGAEGVEFLSTPAQGERQEPSPRGRRRRERR